MRAAAAAALGVLLAVPTVRAAENRPHLALEEAVFDFGAVDRGASVAHTFRLPNRGSADLHIDHVKTSCGCTAAVLTERVIAPGAEGRVAVTLDTARLAGRTTKTVTVYTDDPDSPVVGLSLAGQVTADLVVTPSPLYLGRIRRGEAMRREVLITPGRADVTYTVARVERSNPAVRATLAPRSDAPGQRLVVELERDIPLGRFNETLTLHTTSPRESVMTLPVFGSVEGDVVVLPPQVTFGVTHGGGTAERELWVRNRGARPVRVTRVLVPEDVASYSLAAVQEGLEYRITVRLHEGLPPGKIEGAIEIFTDHPDERHLVVPLYAIVLRDGRRRG